MQWCPPQITASTTLQMFTLIDQLVNQPNWQQKTFTQLALNISRVSFRPSNVG